MRRVAERAGVEALRREFVPAAAALWAAEFPRALQLEFHSDVLKADLDATRVTFDVLNDLGIRRGARREPARAPDLAGLPIRSVKINRQLMQRAMVHETERAYFRAPRPLRLDGRAARRRRRRHARPAGLPGGASATPRSGSPSACRSRSTRRAGCSTRTTLWISCGSVSGAFYSASARLPLPRRANPPGTMTDATGSCMVVVERTLGAQAT